MDQSEYTLKIKVDSLVQIYNSVHSNTGIKSYSFEKLIELCIQESCSDIIIDRARKVVQETSTWNLNKEERRSLYQKVGRALDQLGESSHAFKVLFTNLKLYDESDGPEVLSQTENDARRCVILAIKAVDVINFAELVGLPAIRQLTQNYSKVFSLLNLFTQASAQEFKQQLAEYADLMRSEGLTE